MFTALYGCGSGPDAAVPPTPTPTPTLTAAYLDISASPTTVKSDNSTTTTITVTALSASYAAVSGVTVDMGADTGIVGIASVVTDETGKATTTFSAGGSAINRTATITATSGTVSAQRPVQIVGSSITMTSTGGTLPDTGLSPVTLTVTALDASGNPVVGAAVALTQTGTGNVTIVPASGVTIDGGKFTATVAGVAAGAVTITAAALGATATIAVTVASAGATFAIDQQTLNGSIIPGNPNPTAMKIGDTLIIQVNAPVPTTYITFATTTGVWNGSTAALTVAVSGGKATATLTTTQAGIANVQVYDWASPSTSDTLTVAMTSGAVANNITLQAAPTTVPMSVGTTTGSSTLIATVRDAFNQPIVYAPVSFLIVNPTSGGETVTPVVALTGVDGKASASFTSGSLPSDATGVKVRAAVVGTTVKTGTLPSGNDAAIIISGGAGSIAFGQATVILVDETSSNYIQPMSVLVANVAGQAVAGQVVTLSLWPIAWSTGTLIPCTPDPDDGASVGTFLGEDINENLILDPGEDGKRTYYATGTTVLGGTKDGFLTPVNSDAGAVPATVTTLENGVAGFNLTYPKDRAIWTVVRIRASTFVDGSETVSQRIFRLPAAASDVSPCLLGCPYVF